jgi:DMSO/TMAO reductase YedYZ molybdopterin-dependent catalytic subunit
MTDSAHQGNQSGWLPTVSRRDFLRLGLAGATAAGAAPLWAGGPAPDALAKAVANLTSRYLTPPEEFTNVGRGYPVPSDLPEGKRREAGLDPETWRLEVVADPASDSKLEAPLSRLSGTALDWEALMKLAAKHAVRYLKVMSCNNIGAPLGMGLWEGVPLREVLWMGRPVENIRHVFYYGYHNDDPKQIFQSWLPVSRVLEDPPGHLPVLLCYKLNGQWLSPKRGGPVRMLAPETYGFKSVKWLQKVFLTNRHQSDDTYANGNNDTNSWLKTCARFDNPPEEAPAGQPVILTGRAQVGLSGLAKVQYWLRPEDSALPANDPYFATAPWKDAEILPLPANWWRDLPEGKRPEVPSQLDPATGRPLEWPMRHCLAFWVAAAAGVPAGRYELRCRTIDAAGHAQPMPRPFQKSGRNTIEPLSLVVKAA